MNSKLVVIESPNKINTIKKYLGNSFVIMATIGHIRDLPTYSLGFDKDDYSPKWVTPSKNKKNTKLQSKKEIISKIKDAAKKSDSIYLASDPDREGEAIAWHVFDILDEKDQKKCKRITFNEISQTAINSALDNPRDINDNWVYSQFARRILDRMIGFRLSRLVQNFLRADSAGRVQSVALKFISDREKEISEFKEEKWWTLDIILENQTPIVLHKLNDEIVSERRDQFEQLKEVSGINFKNRETAEYVRDKLAKNFVVYDVSEPKIYSVNPKAPYRTSTLQQDAINKLSWSSKKITLIAQKLYEGISINGDYKALITYPRTDSIRVSDGFKNGVRDYIIKNYGDKYLGEFSAKKANALTREIIVQDAHEAIHPIDINVTPSSIKSSVEENYYALYKLIWIRALAAFMAPAKFSRVDVRFINNGCKFYAVNRERVFDGYNRIYSDFETNEATSNHLISLQDFTIGKCFEALSREINEHKSLPPPRFTQASLIAALEKAGIGRPSTYNLMTNIAVDRGYAELKNRSYYLTKLGESVIDNLEKYFPKIINKEFTRGMERNLDKIADGDLQYREYLKLFWEEFNKITDEVREKLKNDVNDANKKELEKVGRSCPQDNGELVYRYAKRTGTKFIGCINFPKCEYHEWLQERKNVVELDKICPKCKTNKLVERVGRLNKTFIGCGGFPKCRYIEGNEQQKKLKKIKKTDS